MFIKKDLRRLHEILVDPEDTRENLFLSKRTPEFNGGLQALCVPSSLPSLMNLKVLNLYDNGLTSIDGIGILASTPLVELNLGGNKLTSLSDEIGALKSLQSLWLDDNQLEEFPPALCQLNNLQTLRLTGNSISTVPDEIKNLTSLENLALDNNDLKEVPLGLFDISSLKSLWLRQNHLEMLPEEFHRLTELEVFSISSNKLVSLPFSLVECKKLRKLYANGNVMVYFPRCVENGISLEVVNLANNLFTALPPSLNYDPVTQEAIRPANETTGCVECRVILVSNPLSKQ